MQKTLLAVVLASSVSLGACATNDPMAGDIAQGAAVGAAGGAAVGAVVPGVNVIEGAAVGAAIGGLAGAVWADQNNDGYVDGYVANGQYYAGTPQGYDPTLRRVATGALGGAALGGVAGAVIPGLSVLEGAVIGAAVGGLAGAIWADRDNDGRVDGYVYNGQYYAGTPAGYDPTLGRVATGAIGGAALGAVAGAVIPGVSILQGAVIGAAVGGLAGAVWADQNNDGQVDGYIHNGQYYQGAPAATTTAPAPTPVMSGERG